MGQRSFRLTNKHREEMVHAVMQEWTKQNPKPEGNPAFDMHRVVAEQLKKHPIVKRTVRFLERMPEDDLKHVYSTHIVNVRILNKQGEERRVTSIEFPWSLADALGVPRLPKRFQKESFQTIPKDHFDRKLDTDYTQQEWDEEVSDYEGKSIKTAGWVSRNETIMVQIEDSHPIMVERKKRQQAQKEWDDEYRRLRTETYDLLQQYSTTNQLREGFPQIVDYMPPHLADPDKAVKLPVLESSRLAERLGIKKETEE